MKLRILLLLPGFAFLSLGAGPCGPAPTAVSELVQIAGYQQPQTPGSGLPEEFPTPAAVTQLLGPNANLNHVNYLRTHLSKIAGPPKVILVLVPGFLGSAATFAPMAEQLVLDMGGIAEVWAIDRRPNQLEDVLGGNHAAAAGALGDLAGVAQGMQFYFGDTDKAPLVGLGGAAGPEDQDVNQNGVIDPQFPLQDAFGVSRTFLKMSQDDMRYAAYWGLDTQARDWKILVDAARAVVGPHGVVVFGGHSAGTGFAGIWAAYDFDPTSGVDAAYQKIDGLMLLEGGGPGAPSANRPTRTAYLSQVAALALPGGPQIYLQSFNGIDVPSLGAAAMVQGVAAYYDPRSAALAQRTPVFGGPPISILFQAPLSNEAAIGAFVDDDFSSFGAFRASIGFSDNGPNTAIQTTSNVNGDYYYFLGNATTDGPLRQWKNYDDPTLPTCPPNTETVSPGCAILNNGPEDAIQPLVWGNEREVTDIKDIEKVQFATGNFTEWYYLTGRVSLDGQYGRDSSSLGDESLLAITQNANMDRPVLAIGGSNGLAPLPSSWNSYFGSIATPAADKEIHIIEGYAHLDILTAKHNDAVPIIRNWVVKLLERKL